MVTWDHDAEVCQRGGHCRVATWDAEPVLEEFSRIVTRGIVDLNRDTQLHFRNEFNGRFVINALKVLFSGKFSQTSNELRGCNKATSADCFSPPRVFETKLAASTFTVRNSFM